MAVGEMIPLGCATKLTTERRTAKGHCTINDRNGNRKWEGPKEGLQSAAEVPWNAQSVSRIAMSDLCGFIAGYHVL